MRYPRPHPRLLTALVALAVPATAAGLAAWQPADEGGSAVCVWRRCTGGACPGCGLTRAFAHLIRFDWAGAMALHPLAPLLAAELVAAWGLWLLARAGRFRLRSLSWVNLALAANAVLLTGVWALRWGAGTLPPV